MPHTFGLDKLALLGASFFMMTVGGVGLYQNVVVMRSWFSDPPASFARINQYGKSEVSFWVPMQALTLAGLVAGVATNWTTPRRDLVIVAVGCYLLVVVVTAAYFAPRIIAWGKMGPHEEPSPQLRRAGKRWLKLSWLRQAVMLIGEVALLLALVS